MLRSLKELSGYSIQATDGEIGKASEFYFDDKSWIIRYMVVDTGPWLLGRKVLISPYALGQPEWATHLFPVMLTRQQVEESPAIDTDRPVSRQQEVMLREHYRWPSYWTAHSGIYPIGMSMVILQDEEQAEEQKAVTEEQAGDPHLRSTNEVLGYHLATTDGEFGHVADFIIDDETWHIRYMVVDIQDWLPNEKVLVPPAWVDVVSWGHAQVHVSLAREQIKNSPKYDPDTPVNREYEEVLYDFYGRPRYWQQQEEKKLLRGNDIIGKPVMVQGADQQFDPVQDVIFDPEVNRLLGFVVDRRGRSSEALIALWEGVQIIGSDVIQLSSAKSVIPAMYAPPIKQMMEQENILNRVKVITTGGQELGKLVDVYFDVQTGQIEGYEVSGGLVTDLLSGHSFMPVSLVIEVNQDVALVNPEAANIVKAQTNGTLDTVHPG
jgi:uncharacterized protein YrrD